MTTRSRNSGIKYGVSFPLSTKIDVNGSKTHPVFSFLKDRTDGLLGSAIKWNFTSSCVANGTTVKRYGPQTSPDGVRRDAEKVLRPSVRGRDPRTKPGSSRDGPSSRSGGRI